MRRIHAKHVDVTYARYFSRLTKMVFPLNSYQHVRQRLPSLLSLLFIFVCGLLEATGQDVRPSAQPVWPEYAKLSIGLADYQGDRTDWDAGSLSTLGPSLGGEVGFIVFPPWLSIGLHGSWARFSDIGRSDPGSPAVGDGGRSRFVAGIAGRLHGPPIGPIRPYGHMGSTFLFGRVNEGARVGFGPRLGAGGDLLVREDFALFAEVNALFALPDGAADLSSRDANEHDLLLFFDFGVRYQIPKPQEPLQIIQVIGPDQLDVGAVGAFASQVNRTNVADEAIRWDFGDGESAVGRDVSHVFAQAGTYTIRVTARHGKAEVTDEMIVRVKAPVPPPRIVDVAFPPAPHHAEQRLPFEATFESQTAATCVWDFGDNTYSKACEASHIYTAAGVYIVALEVTNAGGTDRFAQTVYVREPAEDVCIAELALESVFFDSNASALNVTARTALRRNLAALLACPQAHVQVNGYAVPEERETATLAEERAQAVRDYYVLGGLLESRIRANGQGEVSGISSSDPRWQYRVAESVATRQ